MPELPDWFCEELINAHEGPNHIKSKGAGTKAKLTGQKTFLDCAEQKAHDQAAFEIISESIPERLGFKLRKSGGVKGLWNRTRHQAKDNLVSAFEF
jgi:hypothetical protein